MSTDPTTESKPAAAARSAVLTLRDPQLWIIVAFAIVLSATAETIGPHIIPIGFASVTLLPMIWGLVLATTASAQRWKPMPLAMQEAATVIMGVAVLFLGARLSFTIGPNVALLFKAGPALLLQEVGHLFGTLLLALPLAVLLRMGPSTVGATFSIDREASFAMVSDRYGSGSPQYRGVLSMYVFGTVFGAIIVSLIASVATSLGIFSPLALAMGAGVGSGSMMAAAAAVIVAGHPDLKDQVLALAATSNLITAVLGLYVGVWVALPLADKFYKALTRRSAPHADDKPAGSSAEAESAAARLLHSATSVPLWNCLLIISAAGLVTAVIQHKGFSVNMILTYLVLIVMVWLSAAISKVTKGKAPGIVVVITLGALLTSPISPIGPWLVATSKSVDLLSVITVMLTIAGLSLGKDLPLLKGIGWRIIPVGAVAIAASFILATLVAEVALRAMG